MKENYKWRFHNEYKMIVNSVFKERLKTVLQSFFRLYCILNTSQSSFKLTCFTSFRLTDPLDSVKKYHQLLRCFKITDLSKRGS